MNLTRHTTNELMQRKLIDSIETKNKLKINFAFPLSNLLYLHNFIFISEKIAIFLTNVHDSGIWWN